jgi:16S rRNA (guanine527-N7)-methyltransferase
VPYKSQKLNEEIQAGKKAISVMGGKIIGKFKFNLTGTNQERSFLLVKKIKKTPNKYPRGGNKPSKEPIC